MMARSNRLGIQANPIMQILFANFREIWPKVLLDHHIDKAYNILLDVVLLLVPLVLMSGFYGLMAKKLWLDIGDSNGK